ncbi:hypothetical protein EJ08DRAFT_703567 [Tothia fuscella]|uniref:Uncharacterized protein n=1 Tax=Tothia fuscella TaxID=1048955 RepID=A0A9P4NE70_9PEZI|nr:hypothetical protein EJ08DRAFT_703567 [Tothia fuscella]
MASNPPSKPLAKTKDGPEILHFHWQDWCRDPCTLVGLHVCRDLERHALGHLLIHIDEERHEKQTVPAVVVDAGPLGRYHRLVLEPSLSSAFKSIKHEQPVKIMEAVTGVMRKNMIVPNIVGESMKITHTDGFYLLGLRLEGMSEIGWICGQDANKEFAGEPLFSSVVLHARSRRRNLRNF